MPHRFRHPNLWFDELLVPKPPVPLGDSDGNVVAQLVKRRGDSAATVVEKGLDTPVAVVDTLVSGGAHKCSVGSRILRLS